MTKRRFKVEMLARDPSDPMLLDHTFKATTKERATLLCARWLVGQPVIRKLVRFHDNMRGTICNLIRDGLLKKDGFTLTKKGAALAEEELS